MKKAKITNQSNPVPEWDAKQLVTRLAELEASLAAEDQNRGCRDLLHQAQRFLQEQHQLLEYIFTTTHLGIAFLDRDLKFIRVNDAYAITNNLPVGYFPGKHHFDVFPGDAQPTFERVMETGRPHTYSAAPFVSPFNLGSGTTYWDCVLQPTRSMEGEITGLALIALNVTGQVNAETALRESREMFEGLFEAAPDANFLLDEKGLIFALNRQAETWFGYHRHELIGKPLNMLIADEEQTSLEGEKIFQIAQTGFQRDSGTSLCGLRKDGSCFPAELTFSPLQYGDNSRVICVVRDITLRVQARREVFEQAGYVRLLQDIAIASNDAKTVGGALQYAVDRICAHTGWPVGHALLVNGKKSLKSTGLWHLDDLHGSERFRLKSESLDYSKILGLPTNVFQQNKADWIMDLFTAPNFRRVEEARIAGLKAMFGFPIKSGDEAVGVLEFFSTVSVPPDKQMLDVMADIGAQLGRVVERDRAKNELDEVRKKLQDRVEDERLRLAMQLHDGPLQSLYGASFHLQDALPNIQDSQLIEDMRDAQGIVHGSIESLRVMVSELRPPTLIPFGLEKTIRSHIERWEAQHPQTHIHLELMRDGLTLTQTTRLVLFRAYQQLLANVARHSQARNVWVRLKLSSEKVVLEVEDDGRGFEPPARWIDLAREGHTGLLGVVERAEDFGGTMEVVRSAGKGVLVRVSLPYQANADLI